MNPPLPEGWICLDGHYIPPHMIRAETPTRITCTNGKTIRKTGGKA